MKITIELADNAIAEQVVKAMLNESYKWEEKREHFAEQFDEVMLLDIPERRKSHRLDYNARRIAECKLTSDELWNIANSIREVIV